jgi:hypothetical protein
MTKKILALISAFLAGGVGIAIASLAPQAVEAGIKYN